MTEPRRDTRTAILEAAMRGFAAKGYEGTGTREIAGAAGVNVASISYHFGGKAGLRAAIAEHVVGLMRGALQLPEPPPAPPGPEAARAILLGLVDRLSTFVLLSPDAVPMVAFILREMSHPSEAFDIVYRGIFESVHLRLCGLWAIATGRDPESEAVKLTVFAMIGQVLYFHVARPVVLRRTGWQAIGPAEARAIAATARRTLEARLDADRRDA